MSTENRVDGEAKYQPGDTPWEMVGNCDRLAALVLPDDARRALTIRYDRQRSVPRWKQTPPVSATPRHVTDTAPSENLPG